ncbi:phenylacetate--CoA ligase family protein [Paractinoplanes globisporus]|uniref:Phenylacetate--CoA ligase family protein n=1 Tax=Paractinoplanes globisporus TaxID=113565 RepID=A0ABW6WFC5_9ACTN|nr:phenylacetate--CoA ligase family protein [Actinoplanes globisporus]
MTGDHARAVLDGLRAFYDAPSVAASATGEPTDGVDRALALFGEAAVRVPAYRAFLTERGIDPEAVRTAADFARLPLLTKDNYLRRYALPELCRDGRLQDAETVAVSSGSSGRPTVWPRTVLDELAVSRRFEHALYASFRADERRTLVVVCFPLGSWVGGMYTAAACRHLAAKGYPLTVATPGNNVEEILRVVTELGEHYDQVVLAGYPPFLKIVIDAGVAWERFAIRLLLAGEVFSETWRDLVGRRAGMTNPVADSVSLYGTADAGVLGNETPLSVSVRRFLADRPEVAEELFGTRRLPTLVQYDPADRFFETLEGTLVFTGNGSVPLVRYHIADDGGTVSYRSMMDFCRGHGFDPEAGRSEREAARLPFVYVFGRSLFAVSYFGANVYPENVSGAVERDEVNAWVTGKFVVFVGPGPDGEPRLHVIVEIAPGAEPPDGATSLLADAVRSDLRRLNSEFANYVPDRHQTPVVELRPAGDPEYFPVGVKHRYTRSS